MKQKNSQSRWNQRYRERGVEAFGYDPSDWLVHHRDLLEAQPKGKALDVACGNGRNSMFLAMLDLEVDAVDISDVALDWLSARIDQQHLRINTVRADLTTYLFPQSVYDVVVNVNYLERSIHHQLARSLRPGGLLLFEAFIASESGRPMNPRFTLEPGELRNAFPELEVVVYREDALIESALQHNNQFARLVARRPRDT